MSLVHKIAQVLVAPRTILISHPTFLGKKTNKFNIRKTLIHDKLLYSQEIEEEIPFYTSFRKGSYTIEVAVVMPLFITLMMFAVFFFRVLQVEAGVQKALEFASRTTAIEAFSDDDTDTQIFAAILLAEEQIVANRVPTSYISDAISYEGSSAEGNYVDLQADYSMTFPIGLLGHFPFEIHQSARSRKWIGYDPAEAAWDGIYVYVTEYGSVYHTSLACSHLDLSIQATTTSQVGSKRNKNGGKYYPCSHCKTTAKSGRVYITDYGNQYHKDINCSRLKRNVRKLLLNAVEGIMPACSDCGG